jgi:hypothetical protein
MFEDEPLHDRASDLLSRGEYADRVARLVVDVSETPTSAVLAIVGPWGSGKTTLLNFVLERLEGSPLRVVKFNPWMVADLPSLVADFFATLTGALPKSKKCRRGMASLARTVSPVASFVKIPWVDLGKGLRVLARQFDDGGSNAQQRRVAKHLKKLNIRILVVLDDIDRLHAEELLMVFKLVRLVGRLPNVYYLLAYDEATVLGVIKEARLAAGDMGRARHYLEKMVQVRLHVPPTPAAARTRYLDGLLEGIFARYEMRLQPAEEQRLSLAYHEHLHRGLREPRQIKRFCSQLEAHFPLVQAEVDFVDYALVCYLRVFHPAVADLLPFYKGELTGSDILASIKSTDAKNSSDRWRGRLKRAGVAEHELDRMLDLLANLFPKAAVAIGKSAGFRDGNGKDRSVGSVDYFDRYFTLGFGADDFPDGAVSDALIEILSASPGLAWSRLVEFLPTDAGLVLRKLRRFIRDENRGAELILPALCGLAQYIPPSFGPVNRPDIALQDMVSELLAIVTPDLADDFVEDLARRSSVDFVVHATVWANSKLVEEGRGSTTSFLNIRTAVTELLVNELDEQATLAARDTDGVYDLLNAWGQLDPSPRRKRWVLNRLEDSGTWEPADFAALLVPIRNVTSGAPPYHYQELGDFDFSLLQDLIAVETFTALIGDPATNPTNVVDTPASDNTSFEARRERALEALAHQASNATP